MNRLCPAKFNATNYVATDAGFQHGCTLKRIRGYFRGSSGSARWLQIHDALTLPADTAVPLRSFLLSDSYDIFKDFGPDGIRLADGLVLCVSTTQATLTISTDTADWMPEVEEFEDLPPDVATMGDLTTAVNYVQVWTEAAGPKRLVKAEVRNNSGQDAYLQVHCADTPDTDTIVGQPRLVPAGEAVTVYFGRDFNPERTVSGTVRQGCTLALSDSANVYNVWGGEDFTLKAWYRD